MKKIAILTTLIGCTVLAGCATITRGSNDVLEIQSTPIGAKVTTSNGYQCEATPCAIKMPRKSEFDVVIEKPGYKTARVHVTHKIADGGGAAMAGNVLVGGIIGAGVDAGTGATLDLIPNPIVVTLERR